MEQHEILRIVTPRVTMFWLIKGPLPEPLPGTGARCRCAIVAHTAARAEVRIGTHDQLAPIDDVPDPAYRLFEQRDYLVRVYAKPGCVARLEHRDPVLLQRETDAASPHVVRADVNFGSQVGLSRFSVVVDDAPELDLEIEVFPSKLDYATDYRDLLADVQGVTTGLALAYLRATFERGAKLPSRQASELEWVVLLRNALEPLEPALRFIAARPGSELVPTPCWTPAPRVRRLGSALRAEIRRGHGRGPLQAVTPGIAVRGQLRERRPLPALDIGEHRWLAEQIRRFRRRVGHLLRVLGAPSARDDAPARDRQIHAELAQLETRLDALSKLPPLAAATAPPPPGYVSLQLMRAPGYREAYQQCLILGMGLRIEHGALEIPVKELSKLYEYWCFITVVSILTQSLGLPITAHDVVAIRDVGLRVLLQEGEGSQIVFAQGERKVAVTFNPRLRSEYMLSTLRPDILISLRDPHWPTMELVIDAKYRVETRAGGESAPPQTTLSDLHRYRDAILEERFDNERDDDARPINNRAQLVRESDARARRSVVHAVAVFPAHVDTERYHGAPLWRSIQRIGTGAIAALPGQTSLLRDWLRDVLSRGGWQLADLAPRHAALESSYAARIASLEPVLIAVLRGANPAEHLAWIADTRQYYAPEHDSQDRRYRITRIAFYVPAGQPGTPEHGAVLQVADVLSARRVARRAIETPWPPSRRADEHQVLYTLRPLQRLALPIANLRGDRVSTPRWSSVLGLSRARELRELQLETEPEWRLLELLRRHGIDADFVPGRPKLLREANPEGRAWFVVGDRMLRFGGASGFITVRERGEQQAFLSITAAFDYLAGAGASPT